MSTPQENAEYILDRLIRDNIIDVWKENWNDTCGFDCSYTLTKYVDGDKKKCVMTMCLLNRMNYDYFYNLLNASEGS